jgi:membrane-associated protein
MDPMEAVAWLISFVLHIDRHLFELAANYGTWIYAILFLIVFCETGLVVTPFLPGDSLLFACGVLIGAGLMGYWQTVGILLTAGILGDAVNYRIGRYVGPAIFHKETRFIKKAYLVKAHAFYERHGGKAIVLARFIPIIRTFAPFVAGIAVMNPATFLLFNVTGCIIWVTSLVSAGYFLGNTPFAREHFSLIIYAIIVVSVMPIVVEVIKGWRRRRKS